MRLRIYLVFLLTYQTTCFALVHSDGEQIDCSTKHVNDYNGTLSTTFSGKTCQAWSSQTPHQHKFNATQLGYDQHNYCRNPGNSQTKPWCFTTDEDTMWELCEVCLCNEDLYTETVTQRECKKTMEGQEYRGTKNVTVLGNECEAWREIAIRHGSMKVPLNECWKDAKNYCRNPNNDSGGPWCYVAKGQSAQREFCYVESCETNKSSTESTGVTTIKSSTKSTGLVTIKSSTKSTGAPTIESTTESVNISNSGLTEVPDDLPTNASSVDLSGNKIVRLGQGVFVRIRNCKVLNLAGNSISQIEAGAFKNLSKLRELALSGNPLREINQGMWTGLDSLKILRIRIRAVHLTTVSPDGFSNLDRLRLIQLNMRVLETVKSHLLNANILPGTRRNLKIVVELPNSSLSCDHSLCWLRQAEKQKLIAYYTRNGTLFRPNCQKNPERYWNETALSCDEGLATTIKPNGSGSKGNSGKRDDYQAVYILLAVVGGIIIIALCTFFILRRAGCIYKKPKRGTGSVRYHYEPRGLDELPVSHSSNVYS